MEQELLKRLSLDDLLNEESAANIENGIAIFRKVQTYLYEMLEAEDEEALTKLKIGTTLTFEVLKRISVGQYPSQYTKEDWKAVADTVTHLSVELDGGEYSVYVFDLYANYIAWSASLLQNGIYHVPEEKTATITALADELRNKAEDFKAGKIPEIAYTEDCLWICLEAMVKLLSSVLFAIPNFGEYAEAAQAAAIYAFEYGRLMLYKKEQALLAEYLQNQKQLDAELEQKFEVFKAELQAEMDQFNGFVENAFSSDIRSAMQGSIVLARAAGVKEEEILKTVADVDDFFM